MFKNNRLFFLCFIIIMNYEISFIIYFQVLRKLFLFFLLYQNFKFFYQKSKIEFNLI